MPSSPRARSWSASSPSPARPTARRAAAAGGGRPAGRRARARAAGARVAGGPALLRRRRGRRCRPEPEQRAGSRGPAGTVSPPAPARKQGVPPEDESARGRAPPARNLPAGPAAMKVARRFSEAFLSYEVGERPARAPKTVFGETATHSSPRRSSNARRGSRRTARCRRRACVNLVPGPAPAGPTRSASRCCASG